MLEDVQLGINAVLDDTELEPDGTILEDVELDMSAVLDGTDVLESDCCAGGCGDPGLFILSTIKR
ncbi:uncharacterized protein APUU_30361A [Aspergillus puulaauensis]|uniref:Uncharacterized protein n=1 Tax=Aspergillus puulaauensis TaxID=1220207 RepID=A0A7R8AKD5_9EURO|nr:uncharacterized protein APUU_30361A [Aspergillus puulaauensis]BCS22136.1 hypothetical protein APUU_30361A [Aspergillus puulaauensis]